MMAGPRERAPRLTFRHSFATNLFEDESGIRPIQEPLGHKDVRTPMVYTQIFNLGPSGSRRPVDRFSVWAGTSTQKSTLLRPGGW